MARGGARAQAGRKPDPDSRGSRYGYNKLGKTNGKLLLPKDGYRGEYPEFPLGEPLDRELELWKELWRTPQAAAWAIMPHLQHLVPIYVRQTVRGEEPDVPASVLTAALRIADNLGLTATGMSGLNWVIDNDDLVAKVGDTPRNNTVVDIHTRRQLPGDVGAS